MTDNKAFNVHIEPGMKNGDYIMFENDGEQVVDQERGDLIFVLKQKKHKTFSRVGYNLYTDINLTLKEALLGFEKTV